MKRMLLTLLSALASLPVVACPLCNKAVRDAIKNSGFYPNLLSTLSAFIALGIIVLVLTAVTTARRKKVTAGPANQLLTPVPLVTASTVLGIGMGGLIDGIILHQVLQVHEMLSAKIPATDYVGKSVNMFWDGIFHLCCFLVVLTGIILLWRLLQRNDINRSGSLLSGGLLLGWGIFNMVEGLIDHHFLKLHNVIEYAANHDAANYSFLAGSIAITFIGLLLIKKGASNVTKT